MRKSLGFITVSSLSAAKTICAGISRVEAYTVVAKGTGYLPNDILTVASGTAIYAAKVRVLTVDSVGGILTVDIPQETYQGAYTSKPSDAVSVTGGSGSGATFNLTWRDNTYPGGASFAYVQAKTQDVTYRIDGGTPTSTVGTVLKAAGLGSTHLLLYGAEMATTKFIEVSASATLAVEFVK